MNSDIFEIVNPPGIGTWGLTANEEDYKRALTQDCWSFREAICWLHGRNPIWCRGDILERFRSEADLALRAIAAGKLSKVNSTPEAWITWAISKNWNVPDMLRNSIVIRPDAMAPVVEHANQSLQRGKRTRKINLRRAIESAIQKIGKKPSFDELWQYFQDDKDETGIIVDYDDCYLIWNDTKGKLHNSPKTTVANHLSRIKS